MFGQIFFHWLPIKRAKTIIDEIHQLLCHLNSVSTEVKACGTWQQGDGHVIVEELVIVYSHCRELADGPLTSLADHAQWTKAAAHQATVGIEIDHDLHRV